MGKELRLEGTIENIIYQNSENGYTVFSVICENVDDLDEVVCVAFIPDAREGELVELYGSFIVHPSYGEQFNVKSYEKKPPNSLAGLEKYLASGVIKGIGEKMAKKIVTKFKKNTLQVIEEHPERLSEIKGITLAKAITIGEVFREQTEQRNVMLALEGYGISPLFSKKIYDKFKLDAVNFVKNNPYILADEIFGIGFKIADEIAYKVGIAKDDPFRINAGVKFVLQQATSGGHSCLPKNAFLAQACEILNAEAEVVENALVTLQMERSISIERVDETVMVYLNNFYYAESYVAKKLIELSEQNSEYKQNAAEEIAKIELESEIVLHSQQKAAVEAALSQGVLVITGGPGTGKTTIINTIIKLLKKVGYTIELAAPTGRAAKRITETTGLESKTIHRLLGVTFSDDKGGRQSFERNEENPLESDILIIDESSMIDILLMYNFLKAVGVGTKLIFVGDADQLPSVGPGNVLRDIINSGIITTVKLSEIFRQNQKSAIIVNAHKINRGEYPELNAKSTDFFMVRRTNADLVADEIVNLVSNRLPGYLKIDGKKDIQVLSPMRKSQIGIHNLNIILQEKLNPPHASKKEKQRGNTIFREYDKVIQIKNNYNIKWRTFQNGKLSAEGEGVFNGDEGIITEINEVSETLMVMFDESKQVVYDFSQLDELELSYAITVHKSQGSEYKAIVLPVHSGPPMLLSRNILYTAITRAKSLVVLVGTEEALKRMVDNNSEVKRYSTLSYRLKKIKKALE